MKKETSPGGGKGGVPFLRFLDLEGFPNDPEEGFQVVARQTNMPANDAWLTRLDSEGLPGVLGCMSYGCGARYQKHPWCIHGKDPGVVNQVFIFYIHIHIIFIYICSTNS